MFDKEYVFYGKHALMVKRLTAKLSDNIGRGFFGTNYDVYRLAPIIGWIYKRTAKVERGEENTKIFAEKLMNEKSELLFNYRNLMMLINKDKNNKDRMDIAFRLDANDDERKEYDEIYNSYVLGGVEEIYERIFGEDGGVQDYLINMEEFIQDLNVRLYGAE